MPEVRVYARSTLAALDWPATPDGDYARRYLTPFILDGPARYIANVHQTEMRAVRVENTVLPITLSRYHPDNSYVCSPYTHYITYGQEEFRTLKSPVIEAGLRGLFIPIGWFFRRSAFDQVVFVNNWLLSTNLYPALTPAAAGAVLDALIAAFPDRAIVFRSLDTAANPALCAALQARGCQLTFSRQVYYQAVQSAWVQRKQQFRFDRKHLERTPYQVVEAPELPADSAGRIVELYSALYLRKYSAYNPQFTPDFIRLALDQQLLTIKAFAHAGRLDAVLGYFERRGLITPPLFGYDTALPQKLGLYRLLSARTSLDALARGWDVHFSGGVGPFKRLRGGVAALEYNGVYIRHLPAARRRPWQFLQALMDRIAVPIIQKAGF